MSRSSVVDVLPSLRVGEGELIGREAYDLAVFAMKLMSLMYEVAGLEVVQERETRHSP